MQTTEPNSIEAIAESLLQPQEDEPNLDEVTDEDDEAPDESPTETDEDDAESPDEDETSEDDESDDEDEEDDEPEVSEEPNLHTVKVDGEEVQVTLEELTRGYAGQKYIQKGMSEAAELRKQAEAQFNALQQGNAQLAQLVQNLQEGGFTKPTAPDIAMLSSDPIGYMEAKAVYDGQLADYNQKAQMIEQQTAQAQAAQAQAQAAYVAEQRAILANAIPEFSDPEKGKVIQTKIRDTGLAYGFAENELSGITDARHVQVLHDAMKYRELTAKKETVAAKTAKARPVVKAGAKKPQNPDRKAQEAKRKRLSQEGSLDAAVDLIFKS